MQLDMLLHFATLPRVISRNKARPESFFHKVYCAAGHCYPLFVLRSFGESKNATLLQDLIDRQEARGPDSVSDVLAEVEELNLPRFEAEMEAVVQEASTCQGRACSIDSVVCCFEVSVVLGLYVMKLPSV